MHIYVGRKFVQRSKKQLNLPDFYLGCIAPDSVSVNGYASKDTRWAAHMRSRDFNKWCNSNADFYHQQTGQVDESLLLGYVMHNITDAAFDKYFIGEIDRELTRANIPAATNHGLTWDEFYRFDYSQRKQPWWANEILPALKKAIPAEINGVDKQLVDKFLTNIIELLDKGKYTVQDGHPIIVSLEMLDKLADIVCDIMDGIVGD